MECARLWPLFIALFVLVGACSAGHSAPQGPPAAPRWQVMLDVSGGVRGIATSLAVDADGAVVVRDARHGLQVEGRTTEIQNRALTQLVDALEARSPTPRTDTGHCADCINYALRITTARGRHGVRLDTLSLRDSSYRPLVEELLALQQAVLEQHLSQ